MTINATQSSNQIINNYCISPGMFRLDGGAMFGIIPKPLWNKKAPADELNRIDLDLRLWLIQTQDKNILVDTGIGNYHGEKFDKRFDVRQGSSPLLSILEKVSLHPDDITDLIISHLHFDHAGGIGTYKDESTIVATFKNATHHIHKSHYDYSLNPTLRDSGSFHTNIFRPVIEQLDQQKMINWIDGQEGTILKLSDTEEIKFMCSHGHTPFLAHPYTSEYMYMADLIPTSSHVHIPWVMGYDISPGITTRDKEVFLDFIDKNELKMIFEHDPSYWGATLKKDDRGNYITDALFKKDQSAINKI